MADFDETPIIVAGSVRALTNCEFMQQGVEIVQDLEPELIDITDEEPEIVPDVTMPQSGEVTIVETYSRCDCVVEQLLREPYASRDFSRTLHVLQNGRPTPDYFSNQLLKRSMRILNEHYYDKVKWLTGCENLGKLYCWFCLIFDPEPGLWNASGYDDLRNFSKSCKRHENSPNHIIAEMQLVAFMLNHFERNLNGQVDENNEIVNINREVLKRIIRAICIAGNSAPIGLDAQYLLRLVRRENSTLVNVPNLHFAVSKSISKAFDASLADYFRRVPFVSLFLDETPEGRIAAILRYTSTKGELKDSFACFIEGNNFQEAINHVKFHYKLGNKLIAILLGRISKPETLPEDPSFLIFHSPVHRVSHVIVNSLQDIKECAAFFHVAKCFENWLKDSSVENEIKAKLPDANVEEWRDRPIIALHEQKEFIQDIVHSILDKPSSYHSSTFMSSFTLQHALKDLEFSFLLRIFKELLPATDALFDMIMSNSPNGKVCTETVDAYAKVFFWNSEKFLEIWESVQQSDMDSSNSKKPRQTENSRLLTFYRSLFEVIVKTVMSQVEMRFGGLQYLDFAELLRLNESPKFTVSDEQMVFLRSEILMRRKRHSFELTRLKNELLITYAQDEFKGLNCESLLRRLYLTGLFAPLRQVTLLARLILVIPYTSKTSNEYCIKLFSKIHALSRRLSEEPELLPWATLMLENQLLYQFSSDESFLNIAIHNFSELCPNVQLNKVTPKTL